MAKDEKKFSTAYGNILSPEDFDNLTYDRRIVYVLAKMKFEDDFGSHTVELCRYLQPQTKLPPELSGASKMIVEIWGDCGEFNGELNR